MASLPHVPPEEYPYVVEQDPMEPRLELSGRRQGRRSGGVPQGRRRSQNPAQSQAGSHGGIGRNPRRRLCAFMPPVEKLEDYLELIAALEATAEELQLPGSCRRLRAALRSARRGDQGDARSRRDRDQRPAGAKLARGRRHSSACMRTRQSPARRQPPGRRPSHRHRRRQSCRGRRLDAAGFAVPAPP